MTSFYTMPCRLRDAKTATKHSAFCSAYFRNAFFPTASSVCCARKIVINNYNEIHHRHWHIVSQRERERKSGRDAREYARSNANSAFCNYKIRRLFLHFASASKHIFFIFYYYYYTENYRKIFPSMQRQRVPLQKCDVLFQSQSWRHRKFCVMMRIVFDAVRNKLCVSQSLITAIH